MSKPFISKIFKHLFDLFIGCHLLIAYPLFSQAQDSMNRSSYSFSGPCTSQGVWTQNALDHTANLKNIISNLKDVPECNSVKKSMINSLSLIQERIGELNKSPNLSSYVQLPGEISALRNFVRENSSFKNDVIQVLLGKSIEQQALASRHDNAHLNYTPVSVGDSMISMSQRIKKTSNDGLFLFNSTINDLMSARSGCLDDSNGVAIISSAVQALASFASSGQSANGSLMAQAVQNLGQFISRDKKYIEALRSLNDREFLTSMSCLIEITSTNYCSALDARYLLREILNDTRFNKVEVLNEKTGQKEIKVKGESTAFKSLLEKGPLAGYYILSRQVPIVSNWIQKVQFGIDPQLPTEADFKINIASNVQNHINNQYRIMGNLNQSLSFLKDIQDFQVKQTYLMNMIINFTQAMIGNNIPGPGNNSSENFFTRVASENEILFRLMGIPVPDAVLGKADLNQTAFVGNPAVWLQARYRDIPQFNDPDALALTVQKNVKELFDASSKNMIAYYNKFFIVDKIQVINDSLLGLDSDVRSALMNINDYLNNLAQRIIKEKYDPTFLPSIQQTRIRIERILEHYSALRAEGLELIKQMDSATATNKINAHDLDEKLKKIGSDFLQEVYEQFDVYLARTGWLSKRVSDFVMFDYTMTLKKRNHFNSYIEDIMFTTGYASLMQMTNMTEIEFTKSKLDIERAMNIYIKNIQSLEEIAGDLYSRNIFELKLRSKYPHLSDLEIYKLAKEAAYNRAYDNLPGENANIAQRTIRGNLEKWWNDLTTNDRQEFGVNFGIIDRIKAPFVAMYNSLLGKKAKIVLTGSGEFDTAQTELSLLCTQTLVFPNLRKYWSLCKDVILESPLKKSDITDKELKDFLDNHLSVKYQSKAYQYIEPSKQPVSNLDYRHNHDARICALRDFHRRNEVVKLTAAMRNDSENFARSFDISKPENQTDTTATPSATATTQGEAAPSAAATPPTTATPQVGAAPPSAEQLPPSNSENEQGKNKELPALLKKPSLPTNENSDESIIIEAFD